MTYFFQIFNTICFIVLLVFGFRFANAMMKNAKATQDLIKKLEDLNENKKK
ncbi:hypothetical protein SAMN02745912_03359 [Paramaledivibacter caminithermalis DSM 15212]|jgi:hypothetical protein|uniref:Uncharacterized protein n=1 Tax=Paramaledivibacter caminithermalis (strain DSM 15212 / CIP 107654 / DViRD3) TaxID=1121301 RepID=A0A1M6SLY7_PARC5|nr:hypothetical protein SAMN02745912_03359 [Paramaledivibacter caminithermalis DSM 15212]